MIPKYAVLPISGTTIAKVSEVVNDLAWEGSRTRRVSRLETILALRCDPALLVWLYTRPPIAKMEHGLVAKVVWRGPVDVPR